LSIRKMLAILIKNVEYYITWQLKMKLNTTVVDVTLSFLANQSYSIHFRTFHR
jgi:hypothetical protein